MNNASGLINLARNIGASTGISFVTTMLDRRAQFHQDVLSGNLQMTNPHLRSALYRITHLDVNDCQGAGRSPITRPCRRREWFMRELQRQALLMLSFVDNFLFDGASFAWA